MKRRSFIKKAPLAAMAPAALAGGAVTLPAPKAKAQAADAAAKSTTKGAAG